ncbi:hypothetical protein, partial [Azospirillum sp. B4]|uniref:hypothetical protein n=1 Tax=Azospirillum sp. B4 TaxID=95605 RepID=UPI0005CA05BD
TVEYDNIQVDDRIVVLSSFTVTAADVVAQRALAMVVVGGRVNYIANGFETRTLCVDIVAG